MRELLPNQILYERVGIKRGGIGKTVDPGILAKEGEPGFCVAAQNGKNIVLGAALRAGKRVRFQNAVRSEAKEAQVEVLFRRKILKQHAFRNLRRVCNVPHGGLSVAMLGKHFTGGVQDGELFFLLQFFEGHRVVTAPFDCLFIVTESVTKGLNT